MWVQGVIILADKSTTKEATWYPIDAILHIRDTKSDLWMKYKSGPWKDDPIPMAEKTAIKAFCRPWAAVADALAHAIYSEEGERMATPEAERPRTDIAMDIVDAELDKPEPEAKAGPVDENVDDEVAALAKDAEDGSLF